MSYDQRLVEFGFVLPKPSAALAAYVPFVVQDKLVFISGQLPLEDGQVKVLGRVGADVTVEDARIAAHLCGLNILAQLKVAAGGSLDHVERCIKLGGFVASAETFYDQPEVINGASTLMEKVFGTQGKHSRFAVGVSSLPRNAAVEIDAIFSLRSSEIL